MCSFLEDGGARAPNHEKRDAHHWIYIVLARLASLDEVFDFTARTLYEEGACHDFVRRDVIRQGGWQNTLKRIIFVLADKGGK